MSLSDFDDDDSCPNTELPEPPPVIDPGVNQLSDRYFTSFRKQIERAVRPREKDLLTMAWGPRMDVIFHPRGALGILGGTVRVMARTPGAEVEIARVAITSADTPIALTVSMGCDEYVIKATLGTDPGAQAKRIESYIYARVYNNGR